MAKNPVCIIAFLLSLCARCLCQTSGTAKIISYRNIPGGIEGKTATANFDIRVYSENSIRVRVSKNSLTRSFSYALVSNEIPDSANFEFKDKDGIIEISTSSITVIIQKRPAFRVIFKNNRNEINNEDMSGLASDLSKMNIELTASINPGIKIDSRYEAYNDGIKKNVFVKYPDGSLFISDIAPSTNPFPDFTNPKTRDWWIDKMKFLQDNGIHGYWNDMNEPAFGGSYLPDNLIFDFDGRKANAPEAKNVYNT